MVSSRLLEAEAAEIEGHSRVWWPEVKYEYEVGGAQYAGDQIQSSGPVLTSTRSAVEEVLSRYPVGRQVQIYFNPEQPEESVLELGSSRGKLLVVLGLILAVAASVVIIVVQATG